MTWFKILFLFKRSALALSLCVFLSSGCSVNILEAFGDKTTPEAQLIEAQKLINDSNFADALTILLALPADFQARRDVRATIASAYAGRAGLIFLDVIQGFQDATSTILFPFLMQGFSAGTVDKISDSGLAEDQMSLISTLAADRTENENIFMALVNFTKMGNILSEYADSDNDGTLDGSFDACPDADTPGTNMPDDMVREFGLSLVYSLNSLSAISDNFAGGVLGALTTCLAIEAADDALSPAPEPLNGICSVTDPADFTALQLKGFRSLIKENSVIGLGAGGCTGDVSACNCP